MILGEIRPQTNNLNLFLLEMKSFIKENLNLNHFTNLLKLKLKVKKNSNK